MATAKKPTAAGPADKGLKVTSRPASFRRGGYTFTGDAQVIPLSGMTQEQVDQIESDTNLVSQRVDIPPPEEDKPKK